MTRPLPAKMPYRPTQKMLNTAWETARTNAGLPDLHVHDLRHTVGMRLREARVSESTSSDVLGHARGSITMHYSVAQVRELREALELIKDDSGRTKVALQMLARQSRAAVKREAGDGVQVPIAPEVPPGKKNGLGLMALSR
jgi:Phage integrase family